ncbi:MAG: beta-phosphoglucomutase [Tenericutes bacterium GWC2_34_14]|nr:MAG: beta-phosphoglucomutase [Tenericutes bacterium GWA2_35_7]OHE28801.1 MAG: beta-phosphoglucomutase [Tenericutes bacterium GWC2_34_14]OHE33269.1 MAG: beta-phosphoglucomutase [Tenericutes bacterium GWE2_34_108]OHE36419.1 MAG: beta-phosphoglucomutase [Tenericutes bacterium GWF1_35_14]OHE37623.1 MAG: beta-phosphoglucomutase [Tenericutes bacterium GWF2_35_184]OHE41368.1 MAG: beta-phosphoglucomutase [Tenericutes bacterium RIFOXYA12_FULL_35_10]OHE45100.1 MAG: beta-phosphoglucomutase [Tenericut
MIQAVIFDLDGVIVSTDELHYKAWKYIADQEGIYFDHVINHRLRGVSRMDSLNIILEKASKPYTEEEKLKLATIKNDYYVTLLASLTPKDILEDVNLVIDTLKQKGIKIAIGSSSKNTKKILKQIGLDQTFDEIADGNDVTRSKPEPDVFLKAAKKLGIDPENCAVVEDAEAGILAAKQAKMTAIAVSDARKSHLADYRFEQLRKMLALF